MLAGSLFKKNSPLLYLDTHAGIGKYDLTAESTQKTREYENGVARIYNLHDCPSTIKTYQDTVRAVNSHTKKLHFYPGSPLIMRMLLRTQDHMVLTELHKEDVLLLKRYFYRDKQVAVHHTNGYQGLKAFLPPKCGRGLILIDPPFEEKNEFEQIVTELQTALKRFSSGIYMIWYPIKNLLEVKNFYANLRTIECKNILAIELSVNKNIEDSGLTSCGLIIINAPWQFEIELKPTLSWLCKALALDSTGSWDIKKIDSAL